MPAARAGACLAIVASLVALASAGAAANVPGRLRRLQDGAYRRLQQTETTLAVDLDPQCPTLDYLVCAVVDFVAPATCDLSSFPDGEDGCCVLRSGSSEVTLPSGLVHIYAVFLDPAVVPVGKTRSQAMITSVGDLEFYMYGMEILNPYDTVTVTCDESSSAPPSPSPSPSPLPRPSPSPSPRPSPAYSSSGGSRSSPSSSYSPSYSSSSSSDGGGLALGIIILIAGCAAAALIVTGIVVVVVRRRRSKRRRLADTGRLFDPDLGDGNTAPKPPPVEDAKVESSAGSAGAETAPHNNNGAVAVAGAGGNTAVASAAAAVAEV